MKARWWWRMLLAALLGASAYAQACDSYGAGGSPSGSESSQGKSGYRGSHRGMIGHPLFLRSD